MTVRYKLLGQAVSGENVTPYTVPASKSALISSIFITNTDIGTKSYDLAVVPSGATLSTEHYLRKATIINAGDFHIIETKVSLSDGDSIVVNAFTSSISINIFGAEL